MTDKQVIIDGVDVLKEKINMCFILLLHKLETPETIEQTIYEHLDVFVEEWNKQLKRKERECEELKQTLAEIKNVAEKQCVCGVDCIDMKQILQLISEVKL